MKKSIVFLLVLLIAVAASAAVKKKRFDVGGGDAPAATEATVESVAPAEPVAAESAVVPEKKTEKTRSLYTVIAEEQKV
ncbi:MAG: hypothetical protein J6T54_00355, partial [Fibrobacter sp.]|nr:hypothetical protein [Fibrobacter sp.]